jgi:redox-sensitive bicupin YhaK (pirin superfamily)
MVYMVAGAATIGDKGQQVVEGDLAVFERDGEEISVRAASDAQFLFLAGEPLNEPVARYGPFVMNTPQEIEAAFADYHSGKMGRLEPDARVVGR